MKSHHLVVPLLALVACGDQIVGGDDAPGNPDKSPLTTASISVEDALIPSELGTAVDSLFAVVTVNTEPCKALDSSLSAKFRGLPMDVVDLGGKDKNGNCNPGVLQIDLGKVTREGDPVVEVSDKNTKVSIGLSADITDTRQITGNFSGSFVLCGGEHVTLAWSNTDDLAAEGAAGAGRAAFHEVCDGGDCAGNGTFSATLAAAAGKLAFDVPKGTALNFGGTGQIEFTFPGAERSGEAPDCDGAGECTFHFTHPTINNATLDRSGCP